MLFVQVCAYEVVVAHPMGCRVEMETAAMSILEEAGVFGFETKTATTRGPTTAAKGHDSSSVDNAEEIIIDLDGDGLL